MRKHPRVDTTTTSKSQFTITKRRYTLKKQSTHDTLPKLSTHILPSGLVIHFAYFLSKMWPIHLFRKQLLIQDAHVSRNVSYLSIRIHMTLDNAYCLVIRITLTLTKTSRLTIWTIFPSQVFLLKSNLHSLWKETSTLCKANDLSEMQMMQT